MTEEFRMKIRYSGGDADDHHLDMYEASTSLQGFARALQLCVHLYVNEEVVSRATALKKAKIWIEPPKRGSVLFDLITIIESYPGTAGVIAAVGTTGAAPFYRFMQMALKKASGYDDDAQSDKLATRLATKYEPHFDKLSEVLEGPLQKAHAPVGKGVPQITLERPRSSLVVFNSTTKAWVNTRTTSRSPNGELGNVTRYNAITSNGRAFIENLGKIVPFSLAENFPEDKKAYLTWSLHGSTTGGEKELRFSLRWIKSARDEVKRVILIDCDYG
ncbi:hypothetical protein [Roseomonas sp. 18066]|uniref:DUF7946 domain-containing protein n=1 Tax=Roseomonas sp. 18066 TaxID=2681412 RepID=UPI001356C270|nr:hypothetical protein [Roseomonas sp. 18066]